MIQTDYQCGKKSAISSMRYPLELSQIPCALLRIIAEEPFCHNGLLNLIFIQFRHKDQRYIHLNLLTTIIKDHMIN